MSRRDLVYERSVRNIAEAIERTALAAGGARIEALWPAVAACGGSRAAFDHALVVLVNLGHARREGARLVPP
jgi:hypothetical protein